METQKWQKVNRLLDEALGPSSPYAKSSKWAGGNKPRPAGWKLRLLQVGCLLAALLLFLTAFGVIPTNFDHRYIPEQSSSSDAHWEQYWLEMDNKKGGH